MLIKRALKAKATLDKPSPVKSAQSEPKVEQPKMELKVEPKTEAKVEQPKVAVPLENPIPVSKEESTPAKLISNLEHIYSKYKNKMENSDSLLLRSTIDSLLKEVEE